MKTKYFFLAALTGLALAGCSSDDFIADAPPVDSNEGMVPIMFTSLKTNFTRADFEGADAAAKLGNQFVVMGFKGEATATPGSVVFDNYLVKYAENTAHTTASNSNNWEYVGVEGSPIAWATANGISSQTIKYWDYSQPQYDFLAWSTGTKTPIYTGTPETGQVYVTAIQPNSKNAEWTEADDPNEVPARVAYTFTGTAADLQECYISDIVTVNKTGDAGIGEVTGYNQPVTLRFRQLGTKVRIGIYENVPGYSVKNVKFYRAAAEALPTENPENAYLFTTAANEIYTEGTYLVYFPTVDKPNDADNNQAHVKFTPKASTDQKTTVDWGELDYTIRQQGELSADEIYLGRTSNTASMAGIPADNYYKVFMPNQQGTNLNLRVNYTLEAIDGGGETIEVKGATAQVPNIYTEWKPGYAYTYLFKISDKTNGYTGLYDPTNPDGNTTESNPAGLYPITFDAVVVNADEDATQETITTVSTPSITSYQKGSTVVNRNEYLATTGDIFVTVNDGEGTLNYTPVSNGTLTAGKVYYTSNEGAGAFIAAGGEIVDNDNKYWEASVSSTTLSTGTLQTLTGKAALYTIPAGMTEAEVIDALSYYYTKAEDASVYAEADPQPTSENFDENTYYTSDNGETPTYTKATTFAESTTYYTNTTTSGTILGRSNKELTGAPYSLVNQVAFGADGNVIPVGNDQALRFKPAAGTYAFVYTKTAPSIEEEKYLPVTKTPGQSVAGLYRYALKNAPAGDVKEGVIYFTSSTEGQVESVFLGQTVNNLYLDDQGSEIASGYAVSNTTYYYTVNNGLSYEAAEEIAYEDFGTSLYVWNETDKKYENTTDTTPQDGTAYYKKTGTDDAPVYKYCVIYPQQTNPTNGTRLKVIDPQQDKLLCSDSMKAVKGMTYFDKYNYNNGERYAKVIKVQ